ncbi:ABC transporter permease [Pseudoxanthomonas koreensis]|uniref:ABC transporter permease n=1 Tax=Pseudoxanthomonas koreensis TaxID=266061 RepID=UPI0035A679DC
MLGYYSRLALRSFRRNRVLTALMVLAIALGVGACMTTLTVFQVLSGNPMPGKSQRLFVVQLDPRPAAGHVAGEEPETMLTRLDAEQLLRQKQAVHQAMMAGGSGTIRTEGSSHRPFKASMHFTSSDFFPMFDTPFRFGAGWSAADDDARARVAVIAPELNARLFGGGDSTGRELRVDGHALRIVGVLDDWAPQPHFYNLWMRGYGESEQVFVPFQTAVELDLQHVGLMHCFSHEPVSHEHTALDRPCSWVQYWVELEDPAQAGAYKAYLDRYSAAQRDAGRFQRPPNTRLRNVMQWLEHRRVVPGDVRLQMWLAFGFLAVCLLNTVSLLLAKFLRRSGEIGVRRALGATRGQVFRQCLVEAGAIGLAGGVLGLGFALAGLWVVRQRPTGYAALAQLDLPMLLLTFVLALAASLLAGLLPAWRAMQVTPAIQLKTQ